MPDFFFILSTSVTVAIVWQLQGYAGLLSLSSLYEVAKSALLIIGRIAECTGYGTGRRASFKFRESVLAFLLLKETEDFFPFIRKL